MNQTKLNVMLHGGDYNPDQWLNNPDVLAQDIEYMKKANVNCVSLGIFAWAALEVSEGEFHFEWMDRVIDELYNNGIYIFLATPSGARPAWMSQKYPEVLRVDENRNRILHGGRHNHCFTSPVYREKVSIINRKLAERYAHHPGIIAWHISNEYGGSCHCDLCQEAFRTYLKEKYQTLDNLNHEWWNTFWAHTYTDWSQIESPSRRGESSTHGLSLDWNRFVTKQTIDFYLNEIKPLKEMNPDIPCTTNFMGLYTGLNYQEFAKVVDFISWDSYPTWHSGNDVETGIYTSMIQEFNRSVTGRPFMMMESTPSMTNWQAISKLKKPGMHHLSSLQAIAHGSDSVQYFQWRKGRGSFEKFHGAVVDHDLSSDHRVFKDVAEVGIALKGLNDVVGSTVKPQVALVYDWENNWAIGFSKGPRNSGMKYVETVVSFYRPFWEEGIPVDIVSQTQDLSTYKLVIAPMLYSMKEEAAEHIKSFVNNGGTLVTTYFTDYVNENDLCHLGGFPGQIGSVLGIKADEIDGLYDHDRNGVVMNQENSLNITGEFESFDLCELITLKGAKALATYKDDFYKGTPALTVNEYGNGIAYHIATRTKEDFNQAFIESLIHTLNIEKTIDTKLPSGVTATYRTDGSNDYVFIMNFNPEQKTVTLDNDSYNDIYTNEPVHQEIKLNGFGVRILKRKSTK